MADMMTRTLKRLLPSGQAWRGAASVLEGVAVSLTSARAFLRAILDEARPESAENLIDDWLDLLGISVSSAATLGQKRMIAATVYVSVGGQSLQYINERIQEAYPDAYVEERGGTFYYYVRGFVPFSRDINTIKALLTRIAPLYLDPVYEVRGVYDGDVARCGIGSTGRAICGRRETAWSDTDGEIARCGVGVTGRGITGRIPA